MTDAELIVFMREELKIIRQAFDRLEDVLAYKKEMDEASQVKISRDCTTAISTED